MNAKTLSVDDKDNSAPARPPRIQDNKHSLARRSLPHVPAPLIQLLRGSTGLMGFLPAASKFHANLHFFINSSSLLY
jgi:hypothetical protein